MSVHANYFTLQLTVPEDRQVLPWLVFDYIKKSHCSVEVVIFRYGVEIHVSE